MCLLFALSLGLLGGCVERRMTIVSDPPNALAIVNGAEVGPTPVDVPSHLFQYYGYYDIKLIKDGYEPLLVKQEVEAPWYERFGLDFISENLVPTHIKDHRVLPIYHMQPVTTPPSGQLLQDANERRGRGQLIGVEGGPLPIEP